jgi:subtilisin-like proprotein convertase family protein
MASGTRCSRAGLARRLLFAALVAVAVFVPRESSAQVPYGRLWAASWDLGTFNDKGQSIATDSAGNVYVAAYDYSAFYLKKFSPAGAPIWTRTVVASGSLYFSAFIDGFVAVDASDNPIFAGTMNASDGTLLDYFVAKYDPAGTQSWFRRFDADSDADSLTAMAVDPDGNIYLHGHGHGSSARNIYTAKYTPDGTRSWVAMYSSADDLGCDVAVHSDGSVYVLGSTTGFATDDDIILIKYDSTGQQQWLRRYNGGGENGWTDDWPARLTLDAEGNAYLVGYSEVSDGGGYGVVTQKYLANGTLAWTRRYDIGFPSSGDLGTLPAGLAVDGAGNVYVSGQILTFTTGIDVVTIKYAADGTPLWSRTYGQPGEYADEPRDLVLAPDGSVFVLAMTSLGSAWSDHRVALLRYDNDGALVSSPIDDESNEGYRLARHGASIHYVGTSVGSNPYVTVRKYSPLPSLSIDDVLVTEGAGGTTNATFTVSLSEASEGTVTVDYLTAGGTATPAVPGLANLANTASVTIAASGAASPYPSTIVVPAGLGSLQKVTVTLSGFNHTWPSDVDVLLVGPGGQSVILMSDVGSATDAVGLTFVFDDTGPALATGTLASGTYRPTNLGAGDTWPSPAPSGPYGTALSVFNGTDPAGVWSLYVVDDTPGDSGSLTGGWSLALTTPPQPGDYTPAVGTLSIPAGATSGTIRIAVFGDTAVEPAETFFVNLANATNAVISDGQGLGTISNDDGAPATGDFTADLKSDILWRHTTLGEVWLWPMDGASKASESFVRRVADTDWEIRGIGDQDGDGHADVLWRNKVTGQVYFWPMDGATPLDEIYVATVDPAYDIVGTGDFNGDGRSDILWRHTTLGDVWIWLMNGATPLSESYVDRVDPGYSVKGVGDLDANGRADIVWHHATTGEVWVWPMDGTARLDQLWVATVPDTGYQIAGVADFTGGGKADILWHHAIRGEVWIWTMDGAARTAETWVGNVPDTGYQIVGSGDYNGDTKADILWHHATRGEVWVWLMDGTTKLSETWVATVTEVGYQIVKAR